MITILIPVLKQGFLESQLHWLSKQTCKDFSVIAMDAYYSSTKYQGWAKKKYPFQFTHLPLIQNLKIPKRCDYSIKNNLALLTPTLHFIFLSDTAYPITTFVANISNSIMKGNSRLIFDSTTVLYTAYDAFRHVVDLGGQTTVMGKPAILFDKKTFFYYLNGYDEATTYCYEAETILERFINTGKMPEPLTGSLYHILHNPDSNSFGKRWRKPCEKCEKLFPRWKFNQADASGVFPEGRNDADAANQMMFADPDLGIMMFQCPNCGFGGSVASAKYRELIYQDHITAAPFSALDGCTGRDLVKLYETINSKVENSIGAKLAFLKTTY